MTFERLHAAVQHHIVNSLGWTALRPLQEAAIEPITSGSDALLLAPTAGGKTEAAILPLLSRMLTETWTGTSILYVCPIKALLNNLHVRLAHLAGLVGRRVEVWHGDIGESARNAVRRDPPDILLTTPESIEAMLVSSRTDSQQAFGMVRVVVVDEVHAFAGDDRGWHLLGVLSRLESIVGRAVQRVGLSATVGNPAALVGWLSPQGRSGQVIDPAAAPAARDTQVALDFVGSLDNAAQVIAQLHRGEKRLVFCDSRARVEDLAGMLRARGVETFVSHSSLGLDERRLAERSFAEGRDCVIVATSTLELGIDVGDLDRVVQIDAPRTVSGFLQRLGRTGRRPGSVRNCLLLATSDDALLHAAALLRLWRSGFVEPVTPPPLPFHVAAQQIMGLALQERGLRGAEWSAPLRTFCGQAGIDPPELEALRHHMLTRRVLLEDQGTTWFGDVGEAEFGRRHFMEIMSVFVSEPLLAVRSGATVLGSVHPLSLAHRGEDLTLSLGGRGWQVVDIDWRRKTVAVVPAPHAGRSRWLGGSVPLSYELCQQCRAIELDDVEDPGWSRRAVRAIRDHRAAAVRGSPDETVLVAAKEGRHEWITAGGLVANLQIAAWLGQELNVKTTAENMAVMIDAEAESRAVLDLAASVRRGDAPVPEFDRRVVASLIDEVKFQSCVPAAMLDRMLGARFGSPDVLRAVLGRRCRGEG